MSYYVCSFGIPFEILFRPTILAARENKLKVNSRFHFSYCYSYCVIRFVNKFYKNTVKTTVFELFANFQNIVLRIGVVLIHFKSTGLDNSLTIFFFCSGSMGSPHSLLFAKLSTSLLGGREPRYVFNTCFVHGNGKSI